MELHGSDHPAHAAVYAAEHGARQQEEGLAASRSCHCADATSGHSAIPHPTHSHNATRKIALICLAACAVICVLLVAQDTGGTSAVELDVSSSIARALEQAQRDSEQAQRDSEPSEHSQHSARHIHDRPGTSVADETRDSEDWSGAKLREMVGRLFKALASLDHRVTRKYNDLHQQLTTSSTAGVTRAEVQQMMSNTRTEVERSVKAASKQLSSVRKGELTMKKLISVQSKLSEQQHRQSEEKLKELQDQGERLEDMALKDKDTMRQTEDEQIEEADGSEGPAMLQTLRALGLQDVLDGWCNTPKNCKLAEKSRMFARKSESKNSRVPAWRCYSEMSLTHDLIHYNGGDSYCTADEELKQLLKSHVGAQLGYKQQQELGQIQGLESELKRVEQREKAVADKELDDQKKLAIVGPDLNFLYSKMSREKGVENSTAHQELLDTHALATLDHRIGGIAQELKIMQNKMHQVRQENEDEVIHGDKEVVQKISKKVQKTMASTEGQLQSINDRLSAYESSQSKATSHMQAQLVAEGQKEEEHHRLVLTMVGDKVEGVTESGEGATGHPRRQFKASATTLAAKSVPVHPIPNQHILELEQATLSERMPNRIFHNNLHRHPIQSRRQSQSPKPLPQQGLRSETSGAGKPQTRGTEPRAVHTKTKAVRKVAKKAAKKPSGCLIHLSGVVPGLDADNSIEC